MTAQPRKLEADADTVHFSDEELRTMLNDMHEIKNALVGDPRYGQKGLVERMGTVEKTILILCLVMVAFGGSELIKLIF